MTSIFAAHRAGIIQLPAEATWREVYGVAILCGIGFTMSLFIGLLAFDDPERESMVKLAVLTGSLLSTLAGAAVLLLRRPATGAQASIPR
jgi:NhaA family Na+:H+ antiporter